MATSGTTTFQLTRNEIITAAAELCAVLSKNQTLETIDFTRGAEYLNRWITAHTGDFPLSKRKEYTFSLVEDVSTYEIGVGKTLNTVYPTRMLQAWSIDNTSLGARTPLEIIGDYNYNLLPLNTSSGPPIQMTYQPLVNYGIIKIWPVPDAYTEDNTTISITYEAPIEVFSSSTNTLDLPQEWTEAVIHGVAALWAPAWGVPIPDRHELKQEAKDYLELAMSAGQENASIFFQVDRRNP